MASKLDTLETGLEILGIASRIAPEIGKLIGAAIKDDPSPLAAQVRNALPAMSESEEAAEEIRQTLAEGE